MSKKKMKAVKSMGRRFERQDEDMTQMPEEESAIFFKLGEKDAAIPAGKTVIDYSLEKFRVGSSRISTLAPDRLIFNSSTLAFWPPESSAIG